MAAVNFYRFSAAVMELLEPDKYNFTRNIAAKTVEEPTIAPAVHSEIASDSTLQLATQAMLSATQTVESKPLSSLTNETTANVAQQTVSSNATTATIPQVAQSAAQIQAKETETIAAVAEHLEKAIANASDEKLAQVALAIKEAAAETALPSAAATQPQVESKPTNTNSDVANTAQLVKSTINALAAQTVVEIKNEIKPEIQSPVAVTEQSTTATTSSVAVSNTVVAQPVKLPEQSVAEKVTTAITDKLKEKIVENLDLKIETSALEVKASPAPPQTIQPLAKDPIKIENKIAENKVEENKKPTDFWELFPELDISGNQYYETVVSLYDYMSHGNLLDILNPAINLDERYSLMTTVSSYNNQKDIRESDVAQQFQKNRYDSADKQREADKETRETAKARQIEHDKWQRQAQTKLDERRAAERMKEMMK